VLSLILTRVLKMLSAIWLLTVAATMVLVTRLGCTQIELPEASRYWVPCTQVAQVNPLAQVWQDLSQG
jgi:hypothetical protein